MSDQIATHQVQRFKEGLRILAQQMGSRFREGVDVDSGATGIKSFYDQIGKTAMVEITNRHGDTQLVETPHRRRMVTPRAYEVADLVDKIDLERITNDPTSTYSQVFASAARRTFDDRVIAAFFASAATGEDGTTSASFPTSTHSIASGSVGMTIDKWANARQILEAFENEEDGEQYKWSIAFQAQQRRNLLNTTEITDVDFNSVKALVRGQIDQFLGFTCVKSERLEKVSSDRYIPAWCRMSMKLAIWHDVEVSIKERVDKRESLQVRAWIQTGATRMDEDGVVRILCQEA